MQSVAFYTHQDLIAIVPPALTHHMLHYAMNQYKYLSSG